MSRFDYRFPWSAINKSIRCSSVHEFKPMVCQPRDLGSVFFKLGFAEHRVVTVSIEVDDNATTFFNFHRSGGFHGLAVQPFWLGRVKAMKLTRKPSGRRRDSSQRF